MPGIDTSKWLQWVAKVRESIDAIRSDAIIIDAPQDIKERTEAVIASMEAWIWEATAAAGEPAELFKASIKLAEIAESMVELQDWYAEEKAARML
jgi:hypothetical protein